MSVSQVPGEADGRACMVALRGQDVEKRCQRDEVYKMVVLDGYTFMYCISVCIYIYLSIYLSIYIYIYMYTQTLYIHVFPDTNATIFTALQDLQSREKLDALQSLCEKDSAVGRWHSS